MDPTVTAIAYENLLGHIKITWENVEQNCQKPQLFSVSHQKGDGEATSAVVEGHLREVILRASDCDALTISVEVLNSNDLKVGQPTTLQTGPVDTSGNSHLQVVNLFCLNIPLILNYTN